MPLSFWANQGLDEDRIKNNTHGDDVCWSDQMGWCYRVRVKTQYKRRKFSSTEVFTLAAGKRRRQAAIADDSAAPAAPKPIKDREEDSSSSSSSSSSSDSDDAQAQPPPETPEQKKLRIAAAKAQAKADAKAAVAKAKAAAKVASILKKRAAGLRTRVINVLKGLRTAVSSPLILDVPASIIEPTRAQIRLLEEAALTLDEVMAGALSEWPSHLDKLDLASAKRAEQLILSVTKSIARAKGFKA